MERYGTYYTTMCVCVCARACVCVCACARVHVCVGGRGEQSHESTLSLLWKCGRVECTKRTCKERRWAREIAVQSWLCFGCQWPRDSNVNNVELARWRQWALYYQRQRGLNARRCMHRLNVIGTLPPTGRMPQTHTRTRNAVDPRNDRRCWFRARGATAIVPPVCIHNHIDPPSAARNVHRRRTTTASHRPCWDMHATLRKEPHARWTRCRHRRWDIGNNAHVATRQPPGCTQGCCCQGCWSNHHGYDWGSTFAAGCIVLRTCPIRGPFVMPKVHWLDTSTTFKRGRKGR